MKELQILISIVIMFVVLASILISGINVGIGLSETHGPKAACERLRFQFYVCSSFKDWEEAK